MPVSGRPTKAALLKITQGSSSPVVKGLQKSAREPEAREAAGTTVAGSGRLRFHDTPKTISEITRPAKRIKDAIRQRPVAASTTGLAASGSREGRATGCSGTTAGFASNVR